MSEAIDLSSSDQKDVWSLLGPVYALGCGLSAILPVVLVVAPRSGPVQSWLLVLIGAYAVGLLVLGAIAGRRMFCLLDVDESGGKVRFRNLVREGSFDLSDVAHFEVRQQGQASVLRFTLLDRQRVTPRAADPLLSAHILEARGVRLRLRRLC